MRINFNLEKFKTSETFPQSCSETPLAAPQSDMSYRASSMPSRETSERKWPVCSYQINRAWNGKFILLINKEEK